MRAVGEKSRESKLESQEGVEVEVSREGLWSRVMNQEDRGLELFSKHEFPSVVFIHLTYFLSWPTLLFPMSPLDWIVLSGCLVEVPSLRLKCKVHVGL